MIPNGIDLQFIQYGIFVFLFFISGATPYGSACRWGLAVSNSVSPSIVYKLKSFRPRGNLSWIKTPIDEEDGDPPHLYRNSDATPVELFFDLFFVANLSTFTATHEINNVEGIAGVHTTTQKLIVSSFGSIYRFPRCDLVYLASGNSFRHQICSRLHL